MGYKTKEQAKAWREANKDRIKEYSKNWESNNKNKRKDINNKHRQKKLKENPDYEAIKKIKLTYKVSEEEAIQLHARAALSCESCGFKWDPKIRRLNVDHDHITGKIRGILCNPCNVTLGQMNDSKERLQNLIDYLGRHNGI
jgi:hypothetical protein